jgi:antitoxin ParD1/3/4
LRAKGGGGMANVTISLSKEQQAFVRAQVKAQGLRSAREYLEQLLVTEQLKAQHKRVDALLLEGVQSGPATPMTGADWKEIEREGLARLAEEKEHAKRRPKKPRRTP